ncbi:hypothetical protein QTH47_13265 [Clostridium perfringens]|nr:hypothetical protein [Clostridium perfringens]
MELKNIENFDTDLAESLTEKFCKKYNFIWEKDEQLEKILNGYAEEYLKQGLGNPKEFKEALLEMLVLKLKTEKYKNNESIEFDLKSCQ